MAKRTRKIFKWVLLLVGTLFGIIALGLLWFYMKRDAITKDLLLSLNEQISGTIQVSDVRIDPLVHFPKTSLTLDGVALYAENEGDEGFPGTPILELESLSISLDLWELFQSRLELTELTAVNGRVYLLKGSDGVFNLAKALGPIKETVQKPQHKPLPHPQPTASGKVPSDSLSPRTTPKVRSVPKPTEASGDGFQLTMEGLHLEDIEVVVEGLPDEQSQRVVINQGNAEIKYVQDSLDVQLDAGMDVDRLGLDSRLELREEKLDVSLNFFFDRGEQVLAIYQGDIALLNTQLMVEGNVDFREQGNASLRYEVVDDQLQFTRLFLSSEGIENLRSGHLHLRGTVEGPFQGQLPQITTEFGATNVQMELPNSTDFLRRLNISGYFESGKETDLSEAHLRLDTLNAELPDGYIRASSSITNLKDPEVSYELDASFKLEQLAQIINLGPIDSLSGKVEVHDTYRGSAGGPLGLNRDQSPEEFTISLDQVSFSYPEILTIDQMSGELAGTLDSLKVDTLSLRSEDSDVTLKGTVKGLSGLFLETTAPLRAEVRLQSGSFDFPALFKSLPRTAEAFPYVISEVDLDVGVEIQVSEWDTLRFVPEMHYEIRSASGVINGLLPEAKLSGGWFHTLEREGSYLLDFEDFKLEVSGYMADVGLAYFGGDQGSNSIAITLETDKLNPGRVFYREKDSIPALVDGELSGRYRVLLQLPDSNGILFQSTHLMAENFEYRGPDTLSISELSLKTNAIGFQSPDPDSLLQSLRSEGDLFIRDLKSPGFQTDSLEVFMKAEEGILTIVPRNYLGKGRDDFGTIVLQPFRSPPRYDVSYRINKLRLEEFLESFLEEEALTGEVDLQIKLAAQGNTREEIASSIFGTVLLEGEDLTLKGVDLDEVIKNFSRSQSFNFVDLGAVLLTGPVGVVYTKGFDYVNLVASGAGDSSRITRFSSRWDVGRGRIRSRDVAFATTRYRLAGSGWLSTHLDSLDMTLAVVDRRGCPIIEQRIYGDSKNPEYSKLNVLETLLAPVTDAVSNFLKVDCKVFYEGVVPHPEKVKK